MVWPVKYKLKCINQDFRVTEVSLTLQLKPKAGSKFTYVWLEKSGLTTFDAMEQIKDFFDLSFNDVNNQGLKDEDAVTEQLISIKKIVTDKDVTVFNKKHMRKNNFSRIKYIIGYGDKPAQERSLHGNSFSIVVRNLNKTEAEKLLDYINSERHHYFINYYDNQRFGMPGGPYNTHLIGEAIVKKNWKQALQHLQSSRNECPEIIDVPKTNADFKKIFQKINPKRVQFYISSYNSHLWNASASSLVKKHTKSKEYNLENIGGLRLPQNPSFQCPHICEVNGYEFSQEKFSAVKKPYKRNTLVLTTIFAHAVENDELHRNKKKVALSFFLPTGSYATMIIRQLLLRLNN